MEGTALAAKTAGTGAASPGHDIIVVGASAGGREAIIELVGQLPVDFPGAIFVALHTPADLPSRLADALNTAGSLPAKHAEDGEEIRHGVVYLARADHHLLVKQGHVRVTRGPRENRWRPAIDPLFRSAAVAYGARVVGVVLSGMLDDGTAGLLAIKRCGGVAIVQDPLEADYADMPESALANVEIDHRLSVSRMGSVLVRLAREAPGESPEVPREIALESRVAETGAVTPAPESVVVTGLMCPECGGPLREEPVEGFPRYRCLVGHAWTTRSLLAGSDDSLEATVWAAIRLFRQRANLLRLESQREEERGRARTAKQYDERSREALDHASRLQHLVTSLETPEKQ